jgi:hypothetical protein
MVLLSGVIKLIKPPPAISIYAILFKNSNFMLLLS